MHDEGGHARRENLRIAVADGDGRARTPKTGDWAFMAFGLTGIRFRCVGQHSRLRRPCLRLYFGFILNQWLKIDDNKHGTSVINTRHAMEHSHARQETGEFNSR